MRNRVLLKLVSLLATTILTLQLVHPGLILAEENEIENEDLSQGPVSKEEGVQEEETIPEEQTPPEVIESEVESPEEEEEEIDSPEEDVENEVTPDEESAPDDQETSNENEEPFTDEGDLSKSKGSNDVNPSPSKTKKKDIETKPKEKTSKKEEKPRQIQKVKENTVFENKKQRANTISHAGISPIEKTLGLQEGILGIITEAKLEDHVISSTNDSTNLHVNLTETAKIKGIVWDALNPNSGVFKNGDLGAVIDEELEHWDAFNYGPGEEQLFISKAYCPYGSVPSLCKEDLAEGVYSIKLSAILVDRFIEGEMEVGPLFVKETSAIIEFDSVEETSLKGVVSDKFIDWAPTVREVYDKNYDVNEYLFASYKVIDENDQVMKEDSLTLNQDGTFAIPLDGLDVGNYTVTVTTEDAGENPPTEESFKIEYDQGLRGEPSSKEEENEQGELDGHDGVEVLDEFAESEEQDESSKPEIEKQEEMDFDETVEVSPNQLLQVRDSSISIQLPEDLPNGTNLTITELHNDDAVGNVVDIIAQLPEGREEYDGTFELTLEIDEEFVNEDVAIFYFNEDLGEWENIGGEVDEEAQTISITVNHLLTYGVFLNEDVEEIEDEEN